MAERGNPGGFGFEGLLRGIGDLLHQAANISSDLKRNGAEGQRPQVESRMSVRTVDGDEVGADFFGLRDLVANARSRRDAGEAADEMADGAPAVVPPERREAFIDVLPDGRLVIAVVELPGAAPDSLKVTVEHDMLSVTAACPGVEYAAEALLPGPVVEATREQSFRNGVLELRWALASPPG
jgi:HSP20 family molecular chaperone IbpA